MSRSAETVYFNAVPLLVLAASYLLVTAQLMPTLWRERRRATTADVALLLILPCIATPALIFGIVVGIDQRPIGNHLWIAFAAILVALVPALIFLARWRERAPAFTGGMRAREAEERVSARDAELEMVGRISKALARAEDAVAAGRALLAEASAVLRVEFAGLALISEDGAEADGLIGWLDGKELDWWASMRLDLRREPSGIASAYFEGAPITVYDIPGSASVSRRLAERLNAQSGVFVPLVTGERVVGVLVAATTHEKRVFGAEELALMEALAAEAALALDRTRSADALEQALERERLVAELSRRVRSERDVRAVLEATVSEVGRVLSATRCFIRLSGDDGEPLAAEWHAQGVESLRADVTPRLAASNLALQEGRTIAVADVATDPRLDDGALGGREALGNIGVQAVLATPIVVFGRLVGVLALHRERPGAWTDGEISLAESVAGETGVAIRSARLLEENERRLQQQTALLKAAQVVTSELHLETVLERLVTQVAELLGADAADCYLLDRERSVLRCAAVFGMPPELIGFEFPADRGLTGRAIKRGRPARSDDYLDLHGEIPHEAYAGFAGAVVAPMTWAGEVRGVLGAGSRDAGKLGQADAELLDAFASLAALALRNAESFEQSSRQARIQRGFYRIADVLGQPLSVAETFDAVAQAAAEALGAAAAAVVAPAPGGLALVAAHDLPAPLAEALASGLGAGDEALLQAAEGRRVLAARRLEGDERFDARWLSPAVAAGYRSLLAVPVEAAAGMVGLVLALFDEERRFTDDDLELARQLARAARGALERSELFEAERSSRALAQQLARTGSLLATELDPEAVLDEVVDEAPALLGADAASIRLLEGDELVVQAATGAGSDLAIGVRAPCTTWLAGDVVQSRLPVAVADVSGERRLLASDPLLSAGHRAYLGVPLVGPEGGVHGVLAVYANAGRVWREEEIEALVALASNASAALSNAELYQRVAVEKERSVAIIANIADGIVAVDRDGNVVLWNEAAARITGVPTEEALGRRPEEVLRRELAPAPDNRPVAIRRGEEEVWLSLTEAIMRDPAGVVAGRIFAFRDISSEHVVEEMKTRFVSTVSHELRTPLTSIYGFAETLLREDVLFGDEERRTFLGYISSESERLTKIVDQLLNVARLETGDLQVQLERTDVGEVVREAVSTAQEAMLSNGHEFVLDLPEEPLAAQADRDKLRQILSNLLDNAVRYSPDGGSVTIVARRGDGAVELRVDDEGAGIPEAERRRIFAKFYRADADAAAGGGGTGLGLFIVQQLVEAMGGRITVDSREPRGSSFVVQLPLPGAVELQERA